MQIPEANWIVDKSPSFKDLKESYLKIMKLSRDHSSKQQPHFIFVYVGGHGATDEEK